jgi:anti-sigma factor RsiW
MTKKDDRNRMNRALDGEMNATETKRFKKRLEKNPEMSHEFRQLRTIDEESIKAIQPVDVSDDFSTRILGKIRKEKKKG